MKKTKHVILSVLMLLAVFSVAACQSEGPVTETLGDTDSYVTIDINPSINLVVSPGGIVVSASPLNEDGELLLMELELVGLTLEEATDLVIAEAIRLGFIDVDAEDLIVSVGIEHADGAIAEQIRDRVKEHINNAFLERGLMGKAQDKVFTPELIEEAEGYGVEPQFLLLAKKAVEVSDTLLLEDALLMEVDDLILIVREAAEDAREVAQALHDEFLAAKDDLIATYGPQIELLKEQIENATEEELDALVAQLETLEAEFRAAMEAVRTEFLTESALLRLQMRIMHQARINEHRAKVEDFLNHMEERREEREQDIEDYQGRGRRP